MAIQFVTTDLAKWGVGTGSPHSAGQADTNFWEVVLRLVALETNPPEAISIDDFAIVGNQLTVLMTDLTTRGPFTIPTATWTALGEWLPETIYPAFGTVTNSGNLYLITHGHTSGLVFDPDAADAGGLLYAKILSPPIQPNDLHIFIGGAMLDAQIILISQATRRWRLPANLTGSFFGAVIAATTEPIITLEKNDVEIGFLQWGIGETVPLVEFLAEVDFEIGDTFSILGPPEADATLANIWFDILGHRI